MVKNNIPLSPKKEYVNSKPPINLNKKNAE
jgi:hypothetical protein